MSDASATIVVDLAFGDCGKGTIVDFFAREHTETHAGDPPLVVRFNGGPQAGHNVVTPAPDGRHHTFAQFGSGTFVPGVRTLLSRFMLIEPYALINELEHLREIGVADALDRLLIDARCPVITPAHQAANRLRELVRGPAAAHGTCGMGVGEAMRDLIERPDLMLRARELADEETVAAKLRVLCERPLRELGEAAESLQGDVAARQALGTLLDPSSWIDAAVHNYALLASGATIVDAGVAGNLLRSGSIILEGAQGVLLDEAFGFHPHTTWSTTTFANADLLLDEAGYAGRRTRLGVLRSYFTRHGPGPLVSEDWTLRQRLVPERHNDECGWQGRFRLGTLDVVAARYALAAAGGVEELAVTHLDRLPSLLPRISTAYECDGEAIRDVPIRRPPDLAQQEELTRRLRRCRPIYAPIDTHDPDRFIEAIERELGVAVSITSHGPTAAEKRRRIGRS